MGGQAELFRGFAEQHSTVIDVGGPPIGRLWFDILKKPEFSGRNVPGMREEGFA